uniref:Uncharacterized protein n=1 Tax=Leptobrachium leishanense TaxID=445787 RepID=A0A8C5RAL7_9ANUR
MHEYIIFSFFLIAGQRCTVIPGFLKQIDAGAGLVFAVTDDGDIFYLYDDILVNFPGNLNHVSVGPAGFWGTNKEDDIFKLEDGNWVKVAGKLKQVDAGGERYLVGVNQFDTIYCLNKDAVNADGTNLPFNPIEGSLMYYSCGPYGCWGVNSHNKIFLRLNVSPTNCKGSSWRPVEGRLVMVEASTDGAVYGINDVGQIYRRIGISLSNPMGNYWTQVNIDGSFKHLAYDAGILWLIGDNGNGNMVTHLTRV